MLEVSRGGGKRLLTHTLGFSDASHGGRSLRETPVQTNQPYLVAAAVCRANDLTS